MKAILDLGPIWAWPTHVGSTGTATCFLSDFREQTSSSGQPYLRLTLEDCIGHATGFVWPESRSNVACPTMPSAVTVTGTVQQFEGSPQLKVHALAPAVADDVPSATALLPLWDCPQAAMDAAFRLIDLEESLPAPLDGFLRQVLLDPAIGMPFMRCRASVAHHHALVGGLLVYSTEMLDRVADVARAALPDDVWAPHLAQVSYLFHDIGKLKSVGEVRRPPFPLVVRHEFATIEMLAPHLRWLEQRNPELATALRYIFSYLATPCAARRVPDYFVAEVVEQFDQWSAAHYNRRDLGHLLHGKGYGGTWQGRRNPARGRNLHATARVQ